MTPPTPKQPSPRTPKTDRIPFVGLTGGIGAGKSTALKQLEALSCATLSADDVVHEIQSRREVIEAIAGRFGRDVLRDGLLDRSAVAEAAFADPDGRSWLEALIWPLVGTRIAEWREEQEAADPPPRAMVVEVPLLFESGMDAVFDATIAVVVDESLRKARAESRGHAAVDERTARQLSQAEKADRATVSVANDGTEQELGVALDEALAAIGA